MRFSPITEKRIFATASARSSHGCSRNGPQVLATGGGAFMHAETRQRVRENGISIWLRAELPVLMRRVMKRDTRPLLREGNPEATMQKLIEARYPVYAEADMTVESRDEPHDIIVTEIIEPARRAGSTAQARTSLDAAPVAIRSASNSATDPTMC